MKTERTLLIVVVLYIAASFYVLPLHAKYYYKQIALKEGLPSTVHCVATDSHGFVWIGTKSGLGRFDGQDLKRYIHDSHQSGSLPGNIIHRLATDVQGNLWALTDKGVARYQYQSDSFSLLTDNEGNPVVAHSFLRTPDGILLGGDGKVYIYNNVSNGIQKVYTIGETPTLKLTSLGFVDSHTLLCCTRWQGMRLLNLQTGECTGTPFGSEVEIVDMLIDSQQRVWIAPYNEGLKCFTRDGTLMDSYRTDNSSLSSNIVLSIIERKGQIWIGTDGGGINILNPETKEFSLLQHIPGKESFSLPNNSVISLYNDVYDNIWVGSIHSGLFSIREVYMQTYAEAFPGNSQGLSNHIVLSLYQQDEKRIWIGTNGGGINCFNPQTGNFAHYASTWGDKVVSICGLEAGKLLISVFSQGMFVFDPATGEKRPFVIVNQSVNDRLCKHGNAVNVYQDIPGRVLLLGKSVYSYEVASRKFSQVSEDDDVNIIDGSLKAIACQGGHTYLNDIKHIYELDNRSNHLRVLYAAGEDMRLHSVSMDENGCFWIGGNQGLTVYDPHVGELQQIPTRLFTEVSSLICDRKGKVWVGAENRLFTWSVEEKRMALFGESDGAAPNEYFPEARLLTRQGDIYMGGVKGLLQIEGRMSLSEAFPQLRLSDIMVNGNPAGLDDGGREITVPWNSSLMIRVMVKEEDIFRQKLYKYQIKGLEKQFVESYDSELSLRALPPGNYQIMASCTAKDGSWTPAQKLLQLTVLPPWYKTVWFVLGCILFAMLVVAVLVRRILRRKEEKLRWKMKEYEREMYEEKVRFLINISHELRTPLTLIYAPLKQLLKTYSPGDKRYSSIKAIHRQAQRMRSLINMVLDVRKMEVGESKLQMRMHPLNQWIEQVSQDFIPEGMEKNIRIRYQLDHRIEEVGFDAGKCEIVLNNLLVNALKYSPQDTEITVMSELLPEQRVRISVMDQGDGLKHVDGQKLFTRFYQGSSEQKGTGIGLSYSKILVELHGGSIGAYDNEDRGATFFFELPLRHEQSEVLCQPKAYLNELIMDESHDEQPSVEKVFDLASYRILIVDDSSELLEFLKDTLCGYFKQVLLAADGEEAIRLMKNCAPDIVVSDVMMPRMNGYDLCRRIKEDISVSHIPVILLTARGDVQSRMSGYKTGADAYLSKPFEVEMLLEMVRSLLRNREAIRKRYLTSGVIPLQEDVTFSRVDESFLQKLNGIIRENLDNTDLGVNFICKELCMNRTTLYNKLKVLTGIGLNDYINKFRMERAMQLIASAEKLSVTEISERVGFTTISYFSTAFKQYVGETPTSYKKKVRSS